MRLVSIKGHNINFLLIPWYAWALVGEGQAFPLARLAGAVLTDSNERNAPIPQKKWLGRNKFFPALFQRRACRATNLSATDRTARPKRRNLPFRVIDLCPAVVSALDREQTVGHETVSTFSLSSSGAHRGVSQISPLDLFLLDC